MARNIDPPNDNPGDGTPGDPGYIPPTGSGSVYSTVVTTTAITITEGQIRDAGGPWASFTIRVTAFNDSGTATPVDFECVAPTAEEIIIDGQI